MGFGFVNFEANGAASAAISALNGKKLREDKVLKVSVARPAWKANIHSNLYVAGFPPSLTEADVLNFLGVHATNAENVRLLRDANKNPRGAAVVRMSCEEAATGVIAALNGVPYKGVPGGCVVQVRPWRPEFRADRISDENIATSYSGRLPAPKSGRRPLMQPAPIVHQAIYPDAQQLLQQMSHHHRQLPVPTRTPETYNTDDEEEDLATLFVFHLPPDISASYLGEMFSQFGGKIESVQVLGHKGYGFISYFNPADAVMAMERLNGISLDGGHKRIRIELKH